MTPLRSVLRPLARPLQVAWGLFPLSLFGIFVAGLSAIAIFPYGLGRIDLIMLLSGLVGLSLVALAALLGAATALVLWRLVRRRSGGEEFSMVCGYPTRTGFSLPIPWYVPFVRLDWSWVDLPADVRLRKIRGRLHEEVTPARRTRRDRVVRRLEVSDVFGLTSIRFSVSERRSLRCVPSVGRLTDMRVMQSLVSGDQLSDPRGRAQGEPIDMRQYAAGDPIRYVLWKVFARSRQLVVRTQERAVAPAHSAAAYVVAGVADEPAAGAALFAVEGGALGSDWVLGADGMTSIATGRADALEVLARSGDVPSKEGGSGLSDFIRTEEPARNKRLLIFVPARTGPWIERVGGAIRSSRGAQVDVLVCTDGVERSGSARSLLARMALSASPTRARSAGLAPTPATEVSAVCRALAACGARVVVLDRSQGRVYAEAHQRALT